MKGLLLKDIMSTRKTIIFCLILSWPIMILMLTENNIFIVGLFFGAMGSTFCLESFCKDGISHWDTYGSILPITRNQIIMCKYLLLLSGNLICFLLTLIPLLIRGWMNTSNLLTIYSFFVVNLLLSCIILMLTYAIGSIHAQKIQLLAYLPVTLAYVIFTELGTFKKAIIFPTCFLPISLIILVIGVSLSFLLSCIIFKNKEL